MPPRALLLVATCCLAASATGGCRQRGAPSPPPLRLVLWHTFNAEETGTLNGVVAEVQARHPEWRIRPTVIPFAHAQNAFRRGAGACGPEAPDLFRAELPWIAEFVSGGLLVPVPPTVRADDELRPFARQAARYEGRRWALPVSVDCLALLYNRALIGEPPRTLGELIDKATAATRDRAGRTPRDPAFDAGDVRRWGLYVRPEGYWFLPFLWAQGGDLFDAARGEVLVDRPAAVAALELYRDLVTRHRVAPKPRRSDDYEDQMVRFGRGEVAMIINGPWAVRALAATPAFSNPQNLGVAPFPRGETGRPAAPVSGHAYVVSRCSKHPAAAWRLAEELSSAAVQARFARQNATLPARRPVAAERREGAARRLIAAFERALAAGRQRPQHPLMARVFDDFTPAVQAVLLEEAPAAAALHSVADAWRRLLGAPAVDAR